MVHSDIQEKCSLALRATVYSSLYGCTFNEEYHDLYIATRKEAQGTKEEKSLARINEQMELYCRWNNLLHPRQSQYTQKCDTNEVKWFALELLSPIKDVVSYLEDKGITAYNPEVKSQNEKTVLLAHSTFETLRGIQTANGSFAFIRDIRDCVDVPLYLADVEVADYRHVMEMASEEIQHFNLTPESDNIFLKARKTSVLCHGSEVQCILGVNNNKSKEHRSCIIYMRHLAAVIIPYQ